MEAETLEFQRSLFPGVDLSEQDLDDLLSPLYPKLWASIRGPFDELLRRRMSDDPWFRVYTEGECAQCLRPQIAYTAHQLFRGEDDVQFQVYRNQLYINYRDQLAITPKKLRPRWLRRGLTFSSYNTEQNIAWWRQRTGDGLPDLVRVIVGYQFIKEMTDIKIYITYPRGKFLKVCYLMPEQSGAELRIVEVPVAEPPESRGFEVVPKKEIRKRGS
jgi:hypothetical protein